MNTQNGTLIDIEDANRYVANIIDQTGLDRETTLQTIIGDPKHHFTEMTKWIKANKAESEGEQEPPKEQPKDNGKRKGGKPEIDAKSKEWAIDSWWGKKSSTFACCAGVSRML